MADTSLKTEHLKVTSKAWHTKSGVRLELELDMILSDEELAELARLAKLNTQLLVRLAVKVK